MNLLLDTHAFIWWDEGKLPKRVSSQIQRAGQVYVSAATAWEIAIKSALGKLGGRMDLAAIVEQSGFTQLPITFEHARLVRDLPRHHADPFDRILIAQAIAEDLALVSRDEALSAYDLKLVWT